MDDFLLVTARLASPLAGDAPQLDALLVQAACLRGGQGVPGHEVDRAFPCPPQGGVPIPLARRRVGGWDVARCSSPILGPVRAETVEHVAKRLAVEDATLLEPGARKVVSTTSSWTKGYRLPLRVRVVDAVAWFARGDGPALRKLLAQVGSIGKKRSLGHGLVRAWEVARVDADQSWYAATEDGPVLMRALPDGPHLPPGLLGARKDFGACVDPYWHPERYTEIVVPC